MILANKMKYAIKNQAFNSFEKKIKIFANFNIFVF